MLYHDEIKKLQVYRDNSFCRDIPGKLDLYNL